VYLIRAGEEAYAFSAKCTHLGCRFNYDPISRRFRCPCHGSVFDLSGKRLAGPAEKDLERAPLSMTKGGERVVTLDL
jgi:Rieske Fe-S protein